MGSDTHEPHGPSLFRLGCAVALFTTATACASTPAAAPEARFALASDVRVEAPATPRAPAVRVAREAPREASEEEQRNSIGLFLGATLKDDSSDGSIGVKYERRLRESTGLGFILEYTPGSNERFVTLPALFLHPYEQLSVALAPGFITEDSDTSLAFRVGAGWDFELGGGFSLAPELNYDFVSGEDNALVLGLTTAYSF